MKNYDSVIFSKIYDLFFILVFLILKLDP